MGVGGDGGGTEGARSVCRSAKKAQPAILSDQFINTPGALPRRVVATKAHRYVMAPGAARGGAGQALGPGSGSGWGFLAEDAPAAGGSELTPAWLAAALHSW